MGLSAWLSTIGTGKNFQFKADERKSDTVNTAYRPLLSELVQLFTTKTGEGWCGD